MNLVIRLKEGSVVVVEETRHRIRKLPIKTEEDWR
ncbi:hypothetical protein KSMBR1_2344 [Candidatus Kuenenia stuttgartiensis]|uniref:Uncharacterized protein n=1 Tax=Kuenenia stuttgartiensis TaxID=174633 RepID=A0A2C9CG12_KUEST|nr:hypothetical protein KSMBR1_2344 [Candidatus Kuenenia stuttgartiensis]